MEASRSSQKHTAPQHRAAADAPRRRETPSDEQLVIELLRSEPEFRGFDFDAEPHERYVDDETMLGLGYPVVALFGDDAPAQVEDPAADVHAAAVYHLDQARIERYLLALPGRDRKVLQLRYGLGCEPLSAEAVAEHVGASSAEVQQVERSTPKWLRDHVGFPDRT